MLRAPLADGLWILAEHALARTGDIAEDEVEAELGATEVARVVIRDEMVGIAPLGDIFQQDIGTLAHWFVGDEDAVVRQEGAQKRRLAARGSAEVEEQPTTIPSPREGCF